MPGVCPERERRATGLDPMKTLARMIHEVSSRGQRIFGCSRDLTISAGQGCH